MQASPPKLHTQPIHGQSRGPMYLIPGTDSPNSLLRVQSRPAPATRRRSEERLVAPKVIRADTLQSRLEGSVYSGRDDPYGGRQEIFGPSDDELRLFARHCKQFYFSLDPPEESSRFISTTLAALPPAHRPAYTRLQSSLRSHAHLHHLRLRVSSFHALLSSLHTSGSLTPASMLQVNSATAQAERQNRLQAFATKWHSPGTEPFFRGVWAVLRVQSRGARGVAGANRVVWEIDDAVLQESGGPDFMQEAVTILKGVLGFSDQPLTTPPRLRRVPTIPRSYSDPRRPPQADSPTNRARATSDPLKDATARLPSRRPSPVGSPRLSEDRPLLAPVLAELEELDDDQIAAEEIDPNKPRFRLWTFPAHITDQEAERLMAALPRSVARDRRGNVKDPPTQPVDSLKALESGVWTSVEIAGEVAKVPQQEEQAGVIRDGTGRIWVGTQVRNPGWPGGRWFRFIRWWKRLLG